MKVSDLMNDEVVTVFGGDTVKAAITEMAESNRGLVVVIDSIINKKVIGVLSNKDVINKIVSKNIDPASVFVSDVMSKNYIWVRPDATSSEAMALMRKYQIKRVLVIENGSLQGIISSNDILDGMLKYKKELLDLAIDF